MGSAKATKTLSKGKSAKTPSTVRHGTGKPVRHALNPSSSRRVFRQAGAIRATQAAHASLRPLARAIVDHILSETLFFVHARDASTVTMPDLVRGMAAAGIKTV